MSFLENNFFLLAITFGIFFFAKLLQKKTGLVLLNPILLTIALLIIFLKMTNISYETYNKGGHLIEFWLRPAVVALGVPLYLQLEMIKKQLLPILLSQLAGCIVGVISVVLILFAILGFIIYKGIGVISWDFLTTAPTDGMTGGGILDGASAGLLLYR